MDEHHDFDLRKDDGRVVLSGILRSWVERDDALNAAWSAPGVTTVIDKIRVHA